MLAPRPVVIRVLAILFSSLIIAGAISPSGRAKGWLLPGQALPSEPLTIEAAPDPQRPAWIINPIGKELLRPSDRSPRALDLRGAVVVSGFSGVTTRTPRLAADRPVVPLGHPHFDWIDPDGASAVILDVDRIGRGFDASEIDPLPRDRLLARDIGQVFGVAIVDEDPEDRIGPALFLTATSAYGLPLVGPDENGDRLPDRLLQGGQGARWMPGLWGAAIGAGPGTVWRVDPQTSAISAFAHLPVGGASLGNIAFDPSHKQLFVSDLDTGRIHRLALDGRVLGSWDHGVTGRALAGLLPMPDDGRTAAPDMTAFLPLDPSTWGIAAPERRVWGLALRSDRLFYAVADGPEVWSVALDPETGDFDLKGVRLEYRLTSGAEIADMVFAPDGRLILAGRPERAGDFAFRTVTSGGAGLHELVQEWPLNPETPFDWVEAKPHDTDFADAGRTALGGVALAPRYDRIGQLNGTECGQTLWSTGQRLRDAPAVATVLRPGGALRIDGVTAQPALLPETGNSPPWLSYFADYDQAFPAHEEAGLVGDVAALECGSGSGTGADGGYPDVKWSPPEGCTGPGCARPFCSVFPWLCGNPPPVSCLLTQASATCDPATGEIRLSGVAADISGAGLNEVKVDGAGLPTTTALPAALSLGLGAMAEGQKGQVRLCAYDASARSAGAPYDCCNAVIDFEAPACKKEGE